MAPLPVNSTARFFLDYETSGHPHTLMVRFGTGSSPGDAMTLVHNFLDALSPLIFLLTVQGARVSNISSGVSFPVTWTGDPTYGSGVGDSTNTAWYLDFVGRGIGGRRARLAVFGSTNVRDGANDDYRISTSDSAAVLAAVQALEAGSDVPVTIDADAVNWHQYANVGMNAYWRNRLR